MRNESDIKNKISERFVFIYDSNRMNHLRKNNFRYIVKGINEQTQNVFWLFDKTPEMLVCLNNFGK